MLVTVTKTSLLKLKTTPFSHINFLKNEHIYKPVCSKVDTADSQVVAAADKTRLQFQSSPIGGYRLL